MIRTLAAALLLMLACHARADSMAELFQAPQPFQQWPPPTSPVTRLFSNIGANQELAWPEEGGPRPVGMPTNATRVLISKYYYSTSWAQGCTLCTVTEGALTLSLYFADGSLYTYSYLFQRSICSDGNSTEESKTTSILDSASLLEPLAYRLRSKFEQRLSQRQRIDQDARVTILAPADSIPPGVRLDVRLAPGAVLDLAANSGLLPLVAPGTASTLHADTILLPQGAPLGALFPGPTTTGPAPTTARSSSPPPTHRPSSPAPPTSSASVSPTSATPPRRDPSTGPTRWAGPSPSPNPSPFPRASRSTSPSHS